MADDDHLAPHVAHGWRLWREFALRGAGFPANDVLALGSTELSDIAAKLSRLDADIAARRDVLIAALKSHAGTLPPDQRGESQAALKRLYGRRLPAPLSVPDLEAMRAALADAFAARAADELGVAHPRAALAASRALRALAARPAFRRAVTWQNHRAVATGIDGLLRQPDGATDSRTRSNERLVASYVQRYAAKCDTIGFFGPVGWGTFGTATRLTPATQLVVASHVFFEPWAMAAFAHKVSRNPELRPALAPRRAATVWSEGTTVHFPVDRTAELPLAYARALAACDGETCAAEIARALVTEPELEVADQAEAYEMLDELVAKRLATWTLEVPTDTSYPEVWIRERLERGAVADASDPSGATGRARTAALAGLERIVGARDAVAAATRSGDEAGLSDALRALDAVFVDVVGEPASRKGGESYAGRTLIYEDCRRGGEVELGPELAGRLLDALEPLLVSARWYTHEVAARCEASLRADYRALRDELGTPTIDYVRFWQRAERFFDGHDRVASPVVAEVVAELQRRWVAILGGPFGPDVRRVDLDRPTIAERARAEFAAPGPGFPSARHHSPDVMISARGPDALTTGDVRFVLGELHTGKNTLAQAFLVNQHVDPKRIPAHLARDAGRRISPTLPLAVVTRASNWSMVEGDLDLESGEARTRRPRADAIGVGELVVEEHNGRVIARTRDRRARFDLLELYDANLQLETVSQFHVLPAMPHTPRVTVGDLVISRERWTFHEPARLPFCDVESPAARFGAVRAWADSQGLPRFLFFKVPEETKPCYLDLASPTYVDLFCRLVRKASVLHVSEMLPAIDDSWLTDADGRRYVSELRVVAVDPIAWHPPTG